MTKRIFRPRSWGVLVETHEWVTWDDIGYVGWMLKKSAPLYTVAWVRR